VKITEHKLLLKGFNSITRPPAARNRSHVLHPFRHLFGLDTHVPGQALASWWTQYAAASAFSTNSLRCCCKPTAYFNKSHDSVGEAQRLS